MREITLSSLTALGLAVAALAPGQSRAAQLRTLVTFCPEINCADGSTPLAGLLADAAGNLIGTTFSGGASDDGTVFEITKTGRNRYSRTPTILVSFDGSNGMYPYAGLIADANGNLFGTTSQAGAGAYGGGTVFEIAKTAGGYAATPTVLVNFNRTDTANPQAGLIADAAGNLFGTTNYGGRKVCRGGCGTVFEITRTGRNRYSRTPTILVSFDGSNGMYPQAGLIADAAGNLFGTTSLGGAYGAGTVFEIAKTAAGYASDPTVLFSFSNKFTSRHGNEPKAALIANAKGKLFGTTSLGGASESGTVFEIGGSGFVPFAAPP
ncbi:MAG TPA: choice-of-anchor tandem repeat GloVer-containing protein [Stellaceae bacterium]|nr:choice-of-anchor tandem repeat GloVer-containing protein [Stellaceae bacterium]